MRIVPLAVLSHLPLPGPGATRDPRHCGGNRLPCDLALAVLTQAQERRIATVQMANN
jgi:hypothetical protein